MTSNDVEWLKYLIEARASAQDQIERERWDGYRNEAQARRESLALAITTAVEVARVQAERRMWAVGIGVTLVSIGISVAVSYAVGK